MIVHRIDFNKLYKKPIILNAYSTSGKTYLNNLFPNDIHDLDGLSDFLCNEDNSFNSNYHEELKSYILNDI